MNAINAEMRRSLNEAFARFREEEEAWVATVSYTHLDVYKRQHQ